MCQLGFSHAAPSCQEASYNVLKSIFSFQSLSRNIHLSQSKSDWWRSCESWTGQRTMNMLWTNKRFGAFNKAMLGKFRFALRFQLFNYFPFLFSSVQLSSDRVFYFDFLGSVNDGQGLSALFSRSFVAPFVSSSLGKGLTMQWLMVKVIDQHDSRCRHLLRLQDLCHVDWIARRLWIIRNICWRALFLQLWTFSPSRQISTEMLDMRLPRHSCHSGRPSPRQGPPPPTHCPPPRSSFDFTEVEVIQVSSSWQLFLSKCLTN